MPIGDDCFEVISRNRNLISQYTKVPVADYEIWSKARDKSETIKLAKQLGVPHPKTYFISEISEVDKFEKDIELPVVIKPKKSSGSRGITYVQKREDLKEAYLKVHSL